MVLLDFLTLKETLARLDIINHLGTLSDLANQAHVTFLVLMLEFSHVLFVNRTAKVWYLSSLLFLYNVLCPQHHVLVYLLKYAC